MDSWIVHKFGGTSVGSAECMQKCINIIRPELAKHRVAVVVSAMGGKPKVTDLLLDLVHAAAAGRNDEIQAKMEAIHRKHFDCVETLLSNCPSRKEKILKLVESDLKDISDLLRAVQLMRAAHEQILELVSGYGEIWSASLLAEALQEEGLPFVFLNARDVLFVSEEESMGTKVFWDDSKGKLAQFIATAESRWAVDHPGSPGHLPHLLITGYIASTLDGVATTLKRDGSDFSASIFGKLLGAKSITIWTDVSGVYSADPRRVPEAQIIPEVSYNEAIELAYFGAKVIHPKTMAPAIDAKIPIFIRNTFEPEHEGTRIYLSPGKGQSQRERSVCGFTTVDGISLLNIEGTGMIGVPGIAHRLFGALKSAHISVMFIAQASSEHSICFATKTVHAARAKTAIEEAFFYELKQRFVSDIRVIDGCSIIAAIGDSMSHVPGVSALFFGSLGGASINILSISQGCDERNISAVVYTKDSTRALRAVHAAFWLSSLDVNLAVVGTGRVGSALLQTLLEQTQLLESRFGLKVHIRGVANSRKMLLGEDLSSTLKQKLRFFANKVNGDGIRKSSSRTSLQDVEAALSDDKDGQQATNLEQLLAHLKAAPSPHTIIIDCTPSEQVAKNHPLWLKSGCHVVTANKRALSSTLDLYNSVFSSARAANRLYMSEVTIGASLPVRTTLNDMLCSGDAVHAIVGLMSVSTGVVLTYVEEQGLTFSEAVAKTYERGLFEDDPFLDLEGTEAASKLLILARELGFSMCMDDIEIEPLARRREVPWSRLADSAVFTAEDADIKQRLQAAAAKGCTLRYVQRIECSPPAAMGASRQGAKAKASVRLEEVPLDSFQALVKGPVYHFSFHTERYAQHPLVVQGPLSDPANTASGIVGDILRIARSIGAKDKGPEILS